MAGNLILDGRFELRRKAGSGGMSTVYRAWDLAREEDVAIKILKPDSRIAPERFIREIELSADLSHPNIVEYIAHGTTPRGDPYLAVEWVEGQTLSDCLSTRGLTFAESVRIVRALASALAVAHARGVVHRDVKPQNILLEAGDVTRVKLIDFGVARWAGDGVGLTQTGTVVGTCGYMSPEQARGEHVDVRADVFSLGCVLYLCLSGRNAFVGESPLAVQAMILFDEPVPIGIVNPEVPPGVQALVNIMLAKDPAARPADGADVTKWIEALPELPESGPRVRMGEAQSPGPSGLGPTDLDAPTAPAAAPFEAIILVGTEESSEEPAVAERQRDVERVRATVAGYGAELQRLRDGTLVVAVEATGPRVAGASRAASCALAVRTVLPTAPMSLSVGAARGDRRFAETIAHGAQSLRAQTINALFQQQPADSEGGIAVDEATAALLGGGFELRHRESGRYLVGFRSAATAETREE